MDMEEVKVFKFEFTLAEVDTILRGLQEMPYRQVKLVFDKIVKSYEEQNSSNVKAE